MLGNAVAAEVSPMGETHRRWLRLGPSDDGVLLVEVEVPNPVDPTEYAKTAEDYRVVSSEAFPSLDEALEALAQRGVDTDSFDAVWKSANPF